MDLQSIATASILLLLWVCAVFLYYRIEAKARREYASRKSVREPSLRKTGRLQEREQMYVSVNDFLAYRPNGTLASARQWVRAMTDFFFGLLVYVTMTAAFDERKVQTPNDQSSPTAHRDTR